MKPFLGFLKSLLDAIPSPIWAFAILAAFGMAWGQSWHTDRLRRQLRASALRADSLVASGDSLRQVLTTASGNLLVYRQRVVQADQRTDALDKALKAQRIANVQLTALVKSYEGNLVSTPVVADGDDSVRVARFTDYSPPYHVAAEVALPKPPGNAMMKLGIALDSIPLGLRLGCGPVQPDGIRPAVAGFLVPAWVSLKPQLISQSPDLCRSPILEVPKRKGSTWKLGLGFGFGVLLTVILR